MNAFGGISRVHKKRRVLQIAQCAELLASGEIEERILTRLDLATADKVWFINSVRGWIPVQMVA